MGDGSIEIIAAGEPIILMPQRTAFWPARSTLLLADLHLGKCETLAAAGVPIPPGIVAGDLARLADAVAVSGARRILILGDMLHAPIGIVPAMIEQVAHWRAGVNADIWLVPGNHDRRVDRVLDAWDIRLADAVVDEPPFRFVHDRMHAPASPCDTFTWSGHVHPRIRLAAGGDSVSLPCFLIGAEDALLPAFSRFTAGVGITPARGECAWAVADQTVIDLTPIRSRRALG